VGLKTHNFLFTQYGTKVNASVEMEDHLIARIKADEMKPRKHPGVMNTRTVEVPAAVISAMKVIIKGKYENTGDFKYSRHFSANVNSVLG
jgi:hypothetical protein